MACFADWLTVMILRFNEAPNVARALDAINWVGRILIVDNGGSTGGTPDSVERYPQARVVTRNFASLSSRIVGGKGRPHFVISQ